MDEKEENLSLNSSRTAMLIGQGGVSLLKTKHVAVFGIGGVGGHVCEALARAGVGALTLFDKDTVAESNINRQIVALRSTLGMPKAEVMAARILDINPECRVTAHTVFYTPQNADEYPFGGYDYIVDAVDTVAAKLTLIERAKAAGVPIISAMGAGNKLHPEKFDVMDISKTQACPLARVMRRELKKRGISKVKVVCSSEVPLKPAQAEAGGADDAGESTAQAAPQTRKDTPGSISFVPSAAGLVLAGAVVRDLLGSG